MLKKLFKYDFNAIFKYWWIGALTTFVLALVGAGCGTILETEKDLPDGVTVFATIGMVLVVLGLLAFIIFSQLLVYVRFYKHLFTDEGYLTFTLPAKRHMIISSKLISGFLCVLASFIITILNAAGIILTTFKKDIFVENWFEKFKEIINDAVTQLGIGNIIAVIIEVIVIGLLVMVLSLLFTYLCITVAGALSKKSKLGAAICIYYFASSAVSVFMYLFYFFGIDALLGWMDKLPENEYISVLILILLLCVLFITMLCILTYTFIIWLIDRKLNLN